MGYSTLMMDPWSQNGHTHTDTQLGKPGGRAPLRAVAEPCCNPPVDECTASTPAWRDYGGPVCHHREPVRAHVTPHTKRQALLRLGSQTLTDTITDTSNLEQSTTDQKTQQNHSTAQCPRARSSFRVRPDQTRPMRHGWNTEHTQVTPPKSYATSMETTEHPLPQALTT